MLINKIKKVVIAVWVPCSAAAELRPAGRRHVVAWWASFGAIKFAALVGTHGAAALGAGSQGDRGDAVNGGRLGWLHDAVLGRRWVELAWNRPWAAQKRMFPRWWWSAPCLWRVAAARR